MIDQFCGEHVVHTFSGRERSATFDFRVKNHDKSFSEINVKAVQVEIDGGFEGASSIYIFEVKNLEATDFNVRQLYFPYRSYQAKCTKPIRCIYLVHSDDVFTFHEFEFKDPLNMSSIQLVRSQSYYIKRPVVDLKTAIQANGKITWKPDYSLPFPQADAMTSIIKLANLAGEIGVSNHEIKELFDFSPRQFDFVGGYYPNASRFLGILELDTLKNPTVLKRTTEFDSAFRLGESAVITFVIERIIQIDGVTKVLEKWRRSEVMPTIEEVVEELQVIREFQVLSESTQVRRARTIRAWCIWIIQHTD
jgi:hypothetical protein